MTGLLYLGLIVYLLGAWRFWVGFGKTHFSSNRAILTLLWPLLLVSQSFRQNFRRALKG